MTIEIEGIDELVRRAQAWELRKRERIAGLVAKTTLAIERDAKLLAPVDTGRLRAAIHSDIERVLAELAGEVIVGVDYAAYVELGTSKMEAQPFLIPALEAHLEAFYRGIVEILGDEEAL